MNKIKKIILGTLFVSLLSASIFASQLKSYNELKDALSKGKTVAVVVVHLDKNKENMTQLGYHINNYMINDKGINTSRHIVINKDNKLENLNVFVQIHKDGAVHVNKIFTDEKGIVISKEEHFATINSSADGKGAIISLFSE